MVAEGVVALASALVAKAVAQEEARLRIAGARAMPSSGRPERNQVEVWVVRVSGWCATGFMVWLTDGRGRRDPLGMICVQPTGEVLAPLAQDGIVVDAFESLE